MKDDKSTVYAKYAAKAAPAAKSFGGSGGIDSGRGRNDAVDAVVAVENGWLFFSFTTIDGC